MGMIKPGFLQYQIFSFLGGLEGKIFFQTHQNDYLNQLALTTLQTSMDDILFYPLQYFNWEKINVESLVHWQNNFTLSTLPTYNNASTPKF